ncbi:helix-turn-helix transcriptional regulator [Streptomyces sp. RKCA744]|uniref:helix-turn-helix transcriptional regulator n=1 Tax=Streptomyces sp. RKCA744 TaxID=2959340 RepID=UPI0020A113BF|nr:helix-turn-helix transcriptional regulator [Streptomyces sp. RKCA744]MCO8308246.1 helix-turn-helix domain-containing protein [Streptomyces sp. RKCA744]
MNALGWGRLGVYRSVFVAANLRQTNDHGPKGVVQVPTGPLPDWVLQQRRWVGDRVRDLREQRGLSQERLAELTGLSRHTVYRIELAQYGTSIDHLALIARALRVEIGSLFS